MRDLRRLKRLTHLKTRLRDAVRANLAQADQALQQSQQLEADAERVYAEAISETTQAGETPAHTLWARAERATRGQLDVRQAAAVVVTRVEAREGVQAELREAQREMKAMELLTQRERLARRIRREQAEQLITDEVVASKRSRST